jgi:hypothetical protein
MMIVLNLQVFSLCILGVLIFVSLFVFSKENYKDKAHENYDDVENIPIYEKVEKPTLPIPTIEDLHIQDGSKLAKVYEMLVRGDLVTPEIIYRALGSKKVGIFIYRLREKGMVIDTLKMPDGKVGYAFRNFKL